MQLSDGASVSHEITTPADGSYRFEHVVPGTYTLRASAEGMRAFEETLQLATDLDKQLSLERVLPAGQIQGQVRSFSGKPLSASVRIEPLGLSVSTDASGAFSVDVPPGAYEVVVESSGYEGQRRNASVELHGVTILVLDLRKEKR